METIMGGSMLERRLTKIFSENKRNYEALMQMQKRESASEFAPLNIKMRVQKDRLIAWGLQWKDRSSSANDIDDSLDRAGISDLVANIMENIKDLLVEAESLQPQPSMGSSSVSGVDKQRPIISQGNSADKLKRLEEIVKDLTMSIDTLCDLSRSRYDAPSESAEAGPLPQKKQRSPDPPRVRQMQKTMRPLSMDGRSPPRTDSPGRTGDLTDTLYIDPTLLRSRFASQSISSPPSYDSIASGSENRTLAYQKPPPGNSGDKSGEIPVLLDFSKPAGHGTSVSGLRPECSRFEELFLALLKYGSSDTDHYTGILKINGWTTDLHHQRSAYVYQIPSLKEASASGPGHRLPNLQPRSLLAFLQNGGDADSSNIPSLDNRFRLALNIAQSVMHLHELNILHRDINSNNVLFFIDQEQHSSREKIWKGPILRKPFLTGFHQSSLQASTNKPETTSFSGIYYHPRLGATESSQAAKYDLVHDYYSLGLVLLEIGLWMPIGKFWKSKYTTRDFRARLQDIYMKKLVAKCGEGYMKATMFCMTAADNLEQAIEAGLDLDHEKNRQDHDFHWNVIRPLERCSMIDADVKDTEVIEPFVDESEFIARPELTEVAEPKAEPTAEPAAVNKAVQAAPDNARKIKVWSHELPALYSTYWADVMYPKLLRILRKAISRMESYSIDLFMAGEDPDTARPTVYMECASTAKVRKILRHLNKELRLFDIKVVSGQITRSKASGKKGKKLEQDEVQDLNPAYQQKPSTGASIGAYLNGVHLPPVTLGGALLVNGEPYGVSVHHMLEEDDELQGTTSQQADLQRSMGPSSRPNRATKETVASLQDQFQQLYPFDIAEAPENEETPSSTGYAYSDVSSSVTHVGDGPPEALYPFDLDDDDEDSNVDLNSETDDDEFWLDDNWEENESEASDDEEDGEPGDTCGIRPGSSEELIVTQPALDDVLDGFFPSPDDADCEHLSSHKLGHIYASSGLRRARDTASPTVLHELDWALIKIHPHRLRDEHHALNDVAGAQRTAQPAPLHKHAHPKAIVPSSALAARAVHAHARTSGLFARGTILPAMRLVRMPGRLDPSHSWPVKGNFGPGGDSGAWVFDDASGAVCGHVLAFSERSGVAYIAPMDVMVRDMEAVIGAKIKLPGGGSAAAEPAEEGAQKPTAPAAAPTSGLRRKPVVRSRSEKRGYELDEKKVDLETLAGIGVGMRKVPAVAGAN